MDSIISTKLPQLASLNQSAFINVPNLFIKVYESICTDVGKHIMEFSKSPTVNTMINTLTLRIKELTDDQFVTKFKSYSQNNVVLLEITKDNEEKEILDKLIDRTRTNLYNLTLRKMTTHLDAIKAMFSNYMKQIFEETNLYLTSHKSNIKSILDEIDGYYQKSKAQTNNIVACDCAKPDSKFINSFCFAGGDYEEIKEGLKLNLCCPKCNKYISHVLSNHDAFHDTIADQYKVKYDELCTLINIYTGACKSCNGQPNSWGKVMLHCGCMQCPKCFKTQCRYFTNNAIIQKKLPKQIAVCPCNKPLDDDISKAVLKEELDVHHRVLRLNSDRKAKEKDAIRMYKLLCVKCGNETDVPVGTAIASFVCCPK